MGKIILVTGGSRSGKSAYAQQMAEASAEKKLFVATCPVLDEELRTRIDRHRANRVGRGWDTAEEQTALTELVRNSAEYPVILIDCLTLWINNLLYQAGQTTKELGEEEIRVLCTELTAACRSIPGTVILVTNELGMGVIPDNPLARRFRDLAGRCNQVVANAADEVTLLVSGLPLFLKKPLA